MADQCIFCKLANGEIPTKTLFEDDKFRIILDAGPLTRGHALIIPKKHAVNVFELDEETAGNAYKLAKNFGEKMVQALHADGMNILQNNGSAAGQSVFHFHMHLIPRYDEDGVKLGMEGGSEPSYSLDEVVEEIVTYVTASDSDSEK